MTDSYRFDWSDEGIEIVVDRLGESRGDLQCEMTIRTGTPFPGLLRQAKFNLSSTRARSEWTKALTERQPEYDWYAAIEQACTLALRRWREGAPFIDLACVEPREDDAYLLRPYVIEGEGTASGVFADGGTGKSLFALTVALSVASGVNLVGQSPTRSCPVLYLDWEWDEIAHAERLQALCTGYEMDVPQERIFYRREVASIGETAANIRAFIASKGVGLVIVDSLGFARGGEPESADLTIRTFAVFRSFAVPVLFVDHLAKNAADKTHSFGSVYTRNSARLMWRMDAEEEAARGESKRLGMVNTKWNRRYEKPRGFLLTTEIDDQDRLIAARFDDCEPPLATLGRSSIRAALISVLRQNPRGVAIHDLRIILEAESIKVTQNVLGATLSKRSNRDAFINREGKWFLVENEAAVY